VTLIRPIHNNILVLYIHKKWDGPRQFDEKGGQKIVDDHVEDEGEVVSLGGCSLLLDIGSTA
jgi:hypothetical protein